MLVNRLYGLSSDYEPELSKIPVKYALEGKKISTSILNKLTDLIDSGKENGFTFIVTEAYRSYNTQKDIYNSYVDLNGRAEADKIVARPGHSEYQTGLTLDLEPYAKTFENPMEPAVRFERTIADLQSAALTILAMEPVGSGTRI